MNERQTMHVGWGILLGVGLLAVTTLGNADRLWGEEKMTQKNSVLKRDVTVEMNYLLYLPEKYEEQKSWPLLCFLHGAGERGENLELVKKHGPPKLIEQGQAFPFIVISPQCPDGRQWEPIEISALLDEICEKYRVDQDRIYLTGLSMGGFGTWRMAAYNSDRLAAIAPVCGGGERFLAKHFADLPVWAFHGAKDTVVPVQRSQEMIDQLKREKAEPRFTVYPEAAHDSWTETYANPELYEWLLSHKRSDRD